MIIIKSLVELLLKIVTWKSGMEKKGSRMNMKKTKSLVWTSILVINKTNEQNVPNQTAPFGGV